MTGQWMCGKPMPGGEHCGRAMYHQGPCATVEQVGGQPASIIRTYRGRSQSDAGVAFGIDAPMLAASGYRPAGQRWDGPSAVGPFLVVIVGAVIGFVLAWTAGALIGAIAGAVVALVTRGDGTLTVAYWNAAVASSGPTGTAAIDAADAAERQTVNRAAFVLVGVLVAFVGLVWVLNAVR